MISAILILVTAGGVQAQSYQQVNTEYKEAYFGYFETKKAVLQKKRDYEDGLSTVKKAEDSKTEVAERLASTDAEITRLQNSGPAEAANLERLKEEQKNAELTARNTLDHPTEADVLAQLSELDNGYQLEIDSYQKNLAIEKRALIRERRSPEFRALSTNVENRRRVLSLHRQDNLILEGEIAGIINQISRHAELMTVFLERKKLAEEELPKRKRALDKAGEELTRASESGDPLRLQIAESNFHRANAEFRRVEIQRNEAELKAAEEAEKIDKKTVLKQQKKALHLALQEKIAEAVVRLAALEKDLEVFVAEKIIKIEERIQEIEGQIQAIQVKKEKISQALQSVVAARKAVVDKTNEIAQMGETIATLQASLSDISGELGQADQTVAQAKEEAEKLRLIYNSSISTIQVALQQAIDKQRANQNALPNHILIGDLK